MRWIRKYGDEEIDFYFNKKNGLCGWHTNIGWNADIGLLEKKNQKSVEKYFDKNIKKYIRLLQKFNSIKLR